MSIRVRGTITIQRKTSARGAFNIGDLATEIGEFEVKDSLIEEFEPGKYTGEFIIKWIAPDSFSWRGRVFVKNRATLDEIIIDEADEGESAPAAPPEPDPIETPPAAPAAQSAPAPRPPASSSPKPPASPKSTEASSSADEELFGEELFSLLQARSVIKLDPTVDRVQFRSQRDRLKELGYGFDAKSQAWSVKELAEA